MGKGERQLNNYRWSGWRVEEVVITCQGRLTLGFFIRCLFQTYLYRECFVIQSERLRERKNNKLLTRIPRQRRNQDHQKQRS